MFKIATKSKCMCNKNKNTQDNIVSSSQGNDPYGVFEVIDSQTPSGPKNAHLK